MNHLHAMRVLIRVAELASFAQAAEQFGLSASAVTRSISALEAHLNVQLLTRSIRKISLTDIGCEYLESARDVIALLDELEFNLVRGAREVRGTLRVVASTTFAECGLFVLLAGYQKLHPQICFEVTTCDSAIDLVPGGYDIGFSMGRDMADSSLVSRQLTVLREIAVASPSYVAKNGTPATPLALDTHRLLAASSDTAHRTWKFFDARTSFNVDVESVFRASNAALVRTAAIAGVGVAVLPVLLVSDDVRAGRLLPVLGQFGVSGERQRVSVVYIGGHYVATKVRSFVDFTVGQYRSIDSAPVLRATV